MIEHYVRYLNGRVCNAKVRKILPLTTPGSLHQSVHVTMHFKIKNWDLSGRIFLLPARLKVDCLYVEYVSKCESSGTF
jgi:hypothetical protein